MNEQPKPQPNASKPIWEMVIEDMHERDQVGRQRYGTPLQAHNGRDTLQDAYEEALNLVVYLRQTIEERNQKEKPELSGDFLYCFNPEIFDEKLGITQKAQTLGSIDYTWMARAYCVIDLVRFEIIKRRH